jgi:hypothetical protein
MAYKTQEELKALFQNGDTPDQDAFGDLIDSCFNNSVSGNCVFNDDVSVSGNFVCDNIILSNQNGDNFRLIVTNSGELSAVSI